MTYLFTGMLSEQPLGDIQVEDSESMVLRKIDHHQFKSGALFPKLNDEQIDGITVEVIGLIQTLKKYNLTDGVWLYYFCWGGELDSIAIAKIVNSKIVEGSFNTTDTQEWSEFPRLMSKCGYEIDKEGSFKPFERNFWGKFGY